MAEALEGLIERLDGHVRYKYMPAAVRTSLEEAAQALRLLGEVEKALEPFAKLSKLMDSPDFVNHPASGWPDDASVMRPSFAFPVVEGDDIVRVRHFRQAKAALDKIRKGISPESK